MQGKKFKEKLGQKDHNGADSDLNFSDNEGGSSSRQKDVLPSSPRENTSLVNDYSSGGSSAFEDFNP
ncbi:hypothetical protein MLD38_001701 [Melastoma candidum]|uniref:Uncharacterized protein n=1 Tax=Melastoma candidum TaxID=119954 RepID=A0ACB9SF30_9MYRT|nr:hypothetical protein MLD38_001701 [Melastoma candidum]